MRETSRLPVRYAAIETVRYTARPGMPTGSMAALGFALPQLLLFAILLWAIWWPLPASEDSWHFAITFTSGLLLMNVIVVWALIRHFGPALTGVLLAPFMRVTVTDSRILWALPWGTGPLFEIGGARIVAAWVGEVDGHGRGNAAVRLVPGDFAADIDGCVHFDRLPDVRRFVRAVEACGGGD